MKRFTKTLAIALAGLGTISSLAPDAMACGGRGGGFGGGFGGPPGGHFAPPQVCHNPFPQPPCVRQPQFPPMNVQVRNSGGFDNFQHPGNFDQLGGFEQPGGFPAAGSFQQPDDFLPFGGGPEVSGSQPPRSVQPATRFQQPTGFPQAGAATQVAGVQRAGAIHAGNNQQQPGGFAQSGGGAIGVTGSQQNQGQPIPGQQAQGQVVQGQLTQGQTSQSQPIQSQPALGQPGQGQAISGQQVPSQQVPTQQSPPAQQTPPVSTQPVSVDGSASAAAPTVGQGQPQGANPTANAQQSALDALGGSEDGSAQVSMPPAQQSVPASQQTQAAAPSLPAGQYTASPGNGSTIRLSLSETGAFTWTATFKGKTSTFQGTFSVSGSAMTLNRSNDSQKLEGSVALTATGFTLKLSGQTDNGLSFVRG